TLRLGLRPSAMRRRDRLDLLPVVDPILVPRMPPRRELPALVPPPQRALAHLKKLRGFPNRDPQARHAGEGTAAATIDPPGSAGTQEDAKTRRFFGTE